MYNSKQKNGLLSESMVISELLLHDIPFAIPYGDFNEYDLIAETPNGFKSLQVKTCFFDNSKQRYIVSLCTSHRRGGETIKNKKYTINSFDYLIAVCHSPRRFYIIPSKEVAGRRSITLYPSGVPNSSENNYRFKSMNNLEKYNGLWEQLM